MFADRTEAGRRLAEELREYRDRERVTAFGIPRGGVIVAAEVARMLGVDLDVLVVRKVGHPGNPEFAAGAIDPDGELILNPSAGVTAERISGDAERERIEAQRRLDAYREGMGPLPLQGTTALLIDDGIATGLTALKAVRYARRHGAEHIVLAAPVMSVEAASMLRTEADDVVAVSIPADFAAVGQFYRDFPQTTDEEVREALERLAALRH